MIGTLNRNIGLDSLRGIFALMVVISHVEYIRYNFGLPNNYLNPIIFHIGKIGVTGFFVLSGFLITNNLLKLKYDDSKVFKNLKLFYLKRTLRIFPLYYIIILLSIFVLPNITSLNYQLAPRVGDARTMLSEVSVYYYLLLPQIPLAKGIVLPFAESTWSIGVEEIFYLFIPLFVLFTPFKKYWLLIIAGLLIFLKLYYWLFVPKYYADTFLNFIALSRYECILVGCYIGCLYFEKNRLFKSINKKHLIVSLSILLLSFILLQLELFVYIHFAIIFAVIILFVAKEKINFLNNKVLVFIGKISFSIYIVHDIAIAFVLNNKTLTPKHEKSNIIIYILVIIISVFLGWVFFKIIEEPFLNLKHKLDNANKKK